MKKLVIAVLIVSMLMVFPTIAMAKKVEISLAEWGDVRWVKQAMGLRTYYFEKEHPEVKVNIIPIPMANYYDKLLTMIAGGVAPDSACIASSLLRKFISTRSIISINQFMEKDTTLDWDDYLGHEEVTYDGKVYGLPAGRNYVCWAYNADMFKEAGLPSPYEIQKQGNWTQEKFIEVAKKLTQDTNGDGVPDQYGFGGWGGYYEFFPLVWMNGGKTYDDFYYPTKCLLNSPEAKKALQYMVDMVKKYKITPPPQMEAAKLGIQFQTGKIAMDMSNIGTACWALFGKWYNFDWNYVLPARGEKGLYTFAEVVPEVIFAQSKNKELTYEFLKSITSLPTYFHMLENRGRWIPARKSYTYDPRFKKVYGQFHLDVDWDMMEKYARFAPKPVNPFRIEEIISNQIDLARRGKKTVDQACEDMTAEINKILQEK